jgi:long-chain fatty acid transport protein
MARFGYLFFVFLFVSSICWGYELPSPGRRAQAMGGAFVGLSDDWSAIYWNPAGLFQLLDKEVAIEIGYTSLGLRDGNSLSNEEGIFGRYRDPDEPLYFEEEGATQLILTPSIGIVLPMKGVTFGFGAFRRMGDHLKWEDDGVDGLDAYLTRRLDLYNGSLCFSAHVAPVVFMGAGLNILHGEYELVASKERRDSYEFNYRLDRGYGSGLEVCVGLLYQPMQKFSLGVVYRGGGVVDIKGKARASCLPIYEKEECDYTRKIHLPPTYGIGIGLRYFPNTIIGIDWSRTGWEVWGEDYEFSEEGANLLKNPEEDLRLRGADRWSIGLEVKPNERWKVMVGGFYSQSPLRDEEPDLLNGMVEMDRMGLTTGLGYRIGDWELGVSHYLSSGSSDIDDISYRRDLSISIISLKTQFF